MKLKCRASFFRLEETNRYLQETQEKLSQEEFICSELSSVQETLYATADQVRTHIPDVTVSQVFAVFKNII